MESEGLTLTNSCPHELKKPVDAISILVVDDDTTCLSIVAAILKKFKYEVVTVKHANDALCTLRIKSGAFDLVVSDVHMPDMNGFELQQAIAQEFNNLPVVLMSADDKEGVALKGLEGGAAFFIYKPVCADDVRDLWQFAAMRKKSKVVIDDETQEKINCNETTIISVSSSSVNEENGVSNKDSKKISPTKEGSDAKKGETSSSQKKPKIIWTNSLHNRFLEAIRSIGLDRAVPKKILEVMDVPGLTRENVASHLQKYRIFLRRVSDASYKIQYSAEHKSLSRNLFRSSLESSSISPSTLMLNRFTKFPYPNQGQHTFPISFPNPETNSSTSLTHQSGLFGQSRFLSNKGNPAGLVNHPNSTFQGHISNITLEHLSSALSATINPSHATSNPAGQTNYVGYSISNLKRLTETGHTEKYDQGLSNFGNYTNINGGGGEQLLDSRLMQLSSSNLPLHHCGNGGGIIHGSGYSPMFDMSEFDALSVQQPLDEVDFDANLGDQVNIQNQAQQNGGENFTTSNFYGGTSHWENCVPSFDQAHNQQYCSQDLVRSQEFGTSSQLNNTMIVPPNEQVCEGLTNSLGFGTSAELLSKTIVPPIERDDDDFLESLLAPFGEDQTLEGI